MAEYIPDQESVTNIPQIIFYIFIITVSAVVTLGNLAVILAMIIQKSLRTPPHLYLGSLALIDFSVGVFILPLRIIQVMNENQWNYGALLCGIFVTADVTLCTMSIYHLIAIAVDRYRAITQGVRYVQRRSFAMVTVTIAFLWIVALWVSTPPSLGWHDKDWGLIIEKKTDTKTCNFTRNKGYVFHSVLGTFILPMTIITVLYYRIYIGIKEKLRKRARPASMVGQNMDFKSTGETSDTYSSEDILEQNIGSKKESKTFQTRIKFRLTQLRSSILPTAGTSSSQATTSVEQTTKTQDGNPTPGTTKSILRQRSSFPLKPRPTSQVDEFVRKKIKFSLSKERRAAKTLGVIIGAFVLCWLPFCILYLIDAFLYPIQDSVYFELCTWMGYVNSGMNPFIYTILNRDFRVAFSKLIFFNK